MHGWSSKLDYKGGWPISWPTTLFRFLNRAATVIRQKNKGKLADMMVGIDCFMSERKKANAESQG
jgi:hypothetical protein